MGGFISYTARQPEVAQHPFAFCSANHAVNADSAEASHSAHVIGSSGVKVSVTFGLAIPSPPGKKVPVLEVEKKFSVRFNVVGGLQM